MFVGRDKELDKLENLYKKDAFQFVVMYGRRRVGKTTLLTRFAKDKPHIFFIAEEYSRERAIADFSKQVYAFLGLRGLPPFSGWNEAFDFLLQNTTQERVLLIIDEYPYLVGA